MCQTLWLGILDHWLVSIGYYRLASRLGGVYLFKKEGHDKIELSMAMNELEKPTNMHLMMMLS